jgi:hypothetical protein
MMMMMMIVQINRKNGDAAAAGALLYNDNSKPPSIVRIKLQHCSVAYNTIQLEAFQRFLFRANLD